MHASLLKMHCKYSMTLARYLMIGMTSVVLVLVSFTFRYEAVRLISARVAEKRFVKVYEDEN